MIICIFSDLHAVLPAWRAFQAHLANQPEQPDIYWCLGDTVGYGPHPVDCLREVRDLIDRDPRNVYLIGNHDAVALRTVPTGPSINNPNMGKSGMHLDAERLTLTHYRMLEGQAPDLLTWLREKKFTQQASADFPGVFMAHGSYINPADSQQDADNPQHNRGARWLYPTKDVPTAGAQASRINQWHDNQLRLMFYGHYHIPSLIRYENARYRAEFQPITYNEWIPLGDLTAFPALINVGSLALPRKADDDPHCKPSTYVLLDVPDGGGLVEQARVKFCTNPYDWRALVDDSSVFHNLYFLRDIVLKQIKSSCLPDDIPYP